MKYGPVVIVAAGTLVAVGAFALGQRGGGSSSPKAKAPAASLQGVCSYSEAAAECWNAQGVKDAELRSLVERSLRANGTNRIQMQFGAKNRILVVAHDREANVQYRGPGGEYLNTTQIQDDLAPKMDLLFVATAPERRTGSIEATINGRMGAGQGTSGRLSLAKDASVDVDGFGFRVRSIDAKPTLDKDDPSLGYNGYNHAFPNPTPPKPRKVWRITVAVRRPEGVRANFSGEAFGRDGARIVNVDDAGRPIALPKPSVMRGMSAAYPAPYGYIRPVFTLQSSGESPQTVTFVSYIDPASIKDVVVGVHRIAAVTLDAIPLDPQS